MSALTEHGLGGCLADDMGLGKTVQVLALLWERRRRRSVASRMEGRPDLVVCPTSVVLGWASEARRFTPELRVHVHQGPERRRTSAGFEKAVAGSDVVVSSYALVNRDRALFEPVEWETLVVDEAHNLKNPRAQKTHALKALRAAARLALTGTPVENRLRDIWSIFNFVLPGLLGGPTRFARAFLAPLRQGDDRAFSRLSRRLGPFLLRRTKKEPGIADELPEKQEQDVFCELSCEQAALYHAMVEATLAGLRDKKGIHRKAHVLAALTHLKQICNHPEAFAAEKPDHLFGRSGKLDRLAELLEELLAEEQAVLLFTQFVGTGELLVRAIEQRFGVVAPFLHGGLLPAARAAIVADFQAPDGPPVLIASLRAGGVGINLTRASAVIHYDRWWNPAVEDQATDRAHRIGQTQRVNVYKLVVRGTLEERILGMLEQKRALAARVLAGADESWLTELGDEELRELLTLGEPLEEGNAGAEEREEEQEGEEKGDGG